MIHVLSGCVFNDKLLKKGGEMRIVRSANLVCVCVRTPHPPSFFFVYFFFSIGGVGGMSFLLVLLLLYHNYTTIFRIRTEKLQVFLLRAKK